MGLLFEERCADLKLPRHSKRLLARDSPGVRSRLNASSGSLANAATEWRHVAMKISVIVPAFNEEQFLGKTLAQIKAAASALANTGWGTELIVCDNNSTDRTAEIARAAGANVVFEPVNQISRARNSGA